MTVAVVVVMTGWVAATQLGDSGDRTVVPAETPSKAAAETPSMGDIDAGRYSVEVIGSTVRAEVTVAGQDWAYQRWLGRRDGSGYLLFWHVGSVPTDACDRSAGSVQLPAGHSSGDLVTALDAQAGTALSQPSAVVVGGYLALRVDLTGPRGTVPGECSFWADPGGYTRASTTGSNPLVIVDVPGSTVLIDLQADATDSDVAQMIESITFTRP